MGRFSGTKALVCSAKLHRRKKFTRTELTAGISDQADDRRSVCSEAESLTFLPSGELHPPPGVALAVCVTPWQSGQRAERAKYG